MINDLTPETRRRIRLLSEKAAVSAWSPAWISADPRRPRPPRLMPKRLYVGIISQFLHGERMTARMCGQLSAALPDPDCRRFLATQIADEERHAEAYARYLDRLGGPTAPDPALAAALERVLAWSGPPQGWLLGFHVLLEGEALRTLADFQAAWPCPLFADVNQRICRDEARHVAFGKLFLRDTLPALSAADRDALTARLRGLWDAVGAGLLADVRVPGIFTRHLRRRWLADGWSYHRRAFADVGLAA